MKNNIFFATYNDLFGCLLPLGNGYLINTAILC
jgi:hypothetical protein